MSTRFQAGSMLDFQASAFALVTGNASGVTPIVSTWTRVVAVRFIDLILTTAITTNVVWTVDIADDAQGRNSRPLDNPPTFPTGVNQSSTVTIQPKADYIRVTATPSAGAGAVSATPGLIVGHSQIIPHCRSSAVHYFSDAANTLAGQAALEFSANFNPETVNDHGLGNLPKTRVSTDELWFAAKDPANTAYVIAAKVATTLQDIPLRLGLVEFVAMRAKLTPTAGFGRYLVTGNSKG